MVRIHAEKHSSTQNSVKTIWKTVAEDLQKESPKTRESPEYKDIKFIIYEDDFLYEIWSLIISLLLLYTSIISPYQICVIDSSERYWMIIDLVIDGFFFADVLVNSILAYYDNECKLVVSKKKIFINYAKFWLYIDISSCLPLQYIIEKNYSSGIRIFRVSKLYRITKLVRFLRIFRLVKKDNKIVRYMSSLFRVHIALERLVWFLITFLLLVHILACLWVYFGKFMDSTDQNWIYQSGLQDLSDWDIYWISVYWATTTLTTVGYGDIKAHNIAERIVASCTMIIGIFLYSYIIGSLTNLLSNLDIREAKLTRKLDIVNRLHREYPTIDEAFYKKIATALEYRHKNSKCNMDSLLADLPISLRTKLLIVIYQQDLQGNAFFENKNTDFVAYIAPMLKPMRIEPGDYVFKTKELACEMYFIISGEVEMTVDLKDEFSTTEVLFNTVKQGYYFGETDLLFSESSERSYNVRAPVKSELLVLSKEGFGEVLKRFEDESAEIMNLACDRNVRLKDHQQSAIEVYLQNKMFRKHISFPSQQDDQLTTDRPAGIHIIPPETVRDLEESRSRNMYNSFIDDKMGKAESDIEWTKKKILTLKKDIGEARYNLVKVIEALS